MRRAIAIGLGVVAGVAILLIGGLIGLTQTTKGHALVRRIALGVLRGPVHGQVRIGRIDGNLLHELILTDVVIADSTGAPMLVVHRIEAHYLLRDLLRERLSFNDVRLDHPAFTLTHAADGTTNVRRIFPPAPADSTKPATASGWGSWIDARDVRVTNGSVTLQGTATIRDLTVRIPVLRLASPYSPAQFGRIASLRAAVAADSLAPAQIRDLTGTIVFTSDSVWWHDARLALPASYLAATGRYVFAGGDLDLAVRTAHVALADLRFASPRIPADGSLAGDITVALHGATQRYDGQHIVLETGGARIAGHGGIVRDSRRRLPLHLLDTDLELSGIDTRLLHRFVPSLRIPRAGVLAGHATASGSLPDVAFNVALTFADHETAQIASMTVRGAVHRHIVRVDRAHVRALTATVDASGTIGLDAAHQGTLTYRIAIDSLDAIARVLPAADSSLDSLAGRATLAGTVSGSARQFDVRSTVSVRQLSGFGAHLARLDGTVTWWGAPSLSAPLALTVHAESLAVHGIVLDTVDARVAYRQPVADVALRARRGPHEEYATAATVTLDLPDIGVRYDSIYARVDTLGVRSVHPGIVHWRPTEITLEDVALAMIGGAGRLEVSGTIPLHRPPTAPIHARLTLDSLSIATVAAVVKPTLGATGTLALQATVEGTLAHPALAGSAVLTDATVESHTIPDVHARFTYDTLTLAAHVEMDRPHEFYALVADAAAPSVAAQLLTVHPFLVGSAAVPVDVTLADPAGARVLERPLRVTFDTDSLPLGLIPVFEPAVTTADGQVHAHISVHGTPRHPDIRGRLTLADGRFHIDPLGVTFGSVAASVSLHADTLRIDSVVARSRGRLAVRGTVDVSDMATPAIDLTMTAQNARVLGSKTRGTLDVDDSLAIAGPLAALYVYGSVRVRDGVVYVPDVGGKQVIDVGSQVVYYVADTTNPAVRAVIPTESSLLEHLQMDVDVAISRGTWVRNNAANVEVHTDDPLTVRVSSTQHAIVVNGAVGTDRGQYTFFTKRFSITQGTATFIGTPELDPTVTATGEYPVSVSGQQPIDVLVLIGGTVSSPRLTLTSDAQPPLSQTDLFTYLAFGSPASQLSVGGAAGSSSGASSGAGIEASNLAGSLGPYVTQRLAGIAIGTFTQALQGDLARSLDADVLNITPASGVPSEVSAKGLSGYFRNTELEFGKYLTTETYVGLDVLAIAPPGARVETRVLRQSTLAITLQPWYLADPTFSPTPDVTTRDVLGVSLTHKWRF